MLRLLALLALTSPAFAESATARFDSGLLSLTQGVFCEVDSIGAIDAPGTVAGKIELYDSVPEFQWLSARVPAVQGLSFGIRTNTRNGLLLDGVVITLTHPAFTVSGATRQTYVTALGGPGPSINAYTFDVSEEMVQGTWTFTAEQNGREIYQAKFEVVSPLAEPEIANSCGFTPMS